MTFDGLDDADDGWQQFFMPEDMQLVWAASLDEIDGVSASMVERNAEWTEGRAPVNSVEQFVSYMEDLRYERFKQRLDRHAAAYA